jgi:predicted DNA-binding transcriptional regulator YafY
MPKKEKRERLGIYRRILRIDKILSQGRYPSTNEILDKLVSEGEGQFSVATIKRDIERMRDDLNAQIKYSKKKEGWYYEGKPYRLPALFTSKKELFAAELLKKMTVNLQSTGIYNDTIKMLDNLTSTVDNPLMETEEPNWKIEERILFLEGNSTVFEEEIWNKVCRALKYNFELTYQYKGYWDNKYKNRYVRPYQLLIDRGVWTLWCWDKDRNAHRLFLLSQMKNVELLDTQFNLPLDFDFRNRSMGYFGAFVTDNKYNFIIQFYPEATPAVKQKKWGEDQNIEELDETEGIELSFSGSQLNKVLSWVLSFGCNAVPIAPSLLVDQWKSHTETMNKMLKERFNN